MVKDDGSEEDKQRLESMGIYSCEKPKRCRSAPLLAQEELFQELLERARVIERPAKALPWPRKGISTQTG